MILQFRIAFIITVFIHSPPDHLNNPALANLQHISSNHASAQNTVHSHTAIPMQTIDMDGAPDKEKEKAPATRTTRASFAQEESKALLTGEFTV
ncbi:hypothetical protein Y032_0007g3511 [Ancylostoma ceylanicum]|uniref:Uncharacterized protein n=1 Tax=Ancylostoma ceylanicum TaxID=53326 RepID=A0A016VPH2_9BILA|nr:hypothetical protein Y032_0007g3511 [Ancylostoma ceylanicum]